MTPEPVLIGRLDDRLTDSRLRVRCGTLLAIAVVVFVLSWSLAFLLLPVGFLRGRTGGALLAGGNQAASSFAVEFARIFTVNFVLVAVAVVAPNVLRTRRAHFRATSALGLAPAFTLLLVSVR